MGSHCQRAFFLAGKTVAFHWRAATAFKYVEGLFGNKGPKVGANKVSNFHKAPVQGLFMM
jgi:hypothetical protein